MQPNKNVPLLRKKMSQWKWFLTSEAIIKERDLFYVTMKWSKQPLNEDKTLSPKEMFLGSSFLTKETSQIYIEWLQHEKIFASRPKTSWCSLSFLSQTTSEMDRGKKSTNDKSYPIQMKLLGNLQLPTQTNIAIIC